MIHYQLRCGQDHEFDGWFRDSAAFDKQAALGLLECPTCGDTKVARALMTPSVPRKRQETPQPQPAEEAKPAPQTPPVPHMAGRIPDHLRAMLQRLRSEVEKNCEYVGPQFADEARKIHAGTSEKHAIYGETTPEQAEALAEDGIQVTRIPWVPRADG